MKRIKRAGPGISCINGVDVILISKGIVKFSHRVQAVSACLNVSPNSVRSLQNIKGDLEKR